MKWILEKIDPIQKNLNRFFIYSLLTLFFININ